MKKVMLLILFLIITNKLFSQNSWCGTSNPEKRFTVNSLNEISRPISVPVFFHIILSTDGYGDVNDSQLTDQINVLNNAYGDTYFSFQLFGITRTTNNYWRNLEKNSQAELDMKNYLYIDTYHVLNIYITNTFGAAKSWSAFPTSSGSTYDGIVLSTGFLLGGDEEDLNLGDVLVHESGHFLGLFHTFDDYGQCKDGDGISDTPMHLVNYGCPSPNPDT